MYWIAKNCKTCFDAGPGLDYLHYLNEEEFS